MAILYAHPGFHPELVAGGIPGGQAKLQVVEKLPPVGGAAMQRNRQLVNPEKSWIMYQVATRFMEDDRVVVHKPISGSENVQATASSSPGSGGSASSGLIGLASPGAISVDSGQPAGERATVPDVVQRLSAPTYTLQLTGRILRLGYRIPTPRVTTAGGVQLTQSSEDVVEGTDTAIAGVPIFFKTFNITYIVPKTPAGVPIVASQALLTASED